MPSRENANTGFSHRPSSCQPGSIRLQQFLIKMFGVTNSGCYSAHSVLSSGKPSWHQYGKAVDMGANWNDGAGRARGDRVFDWVLAHANELNLQQMIWGNRIWDVSYRGVRRYTHHDHENHVHIALGYAASQNWSPSGPIPAPPTADPRKKATVFLLKDDSAAPITYVSDWQTKRKVADTNELGAIQFCLKSYGLPFEPIPVPKAILDRVPLGS